METSWTNYKSLYEKSGSGINRILYNGHHITDKSQICNVMNEYFCGVGKKLQTKMPDCGGELLNYLPEQIRETFFLSPVVQEELVIEIQKLNPRKSCGPDDIGAKVIQLCLTIFADNLSKIYNHSIEICDYPSELKIAKVIALFKKGEKFNPNNYRPISLLSCFNKLFEKLLYKRLVKFLERNQISFNYQYGFWKLHSTTLALIEFTDTIMRFLDEGNYCRSVFIDLTKAFDTVDYEILLHKLERYGIRGHASMFLRSYLSNRHRYTAINDLSSPLRKVQCGVPQGSVLGPLLFIFGTACQIYCYGRYCVTQSVSPKVPESPSGPLVDNFIVLPCVACGVACVKLQLGVDRWNSLDDPRVIGPCHCDVWGWPRHQADFDWFFGGPILETSHRGASFRVTHTANRKC